MVYWGDCLEKLKDLEANSVDAVVTDPPYGLSFMGKKWDYDVPSIEVWHEVIRVMKPGAHLLSFGGTRTYHRMVVAIEDAGFEVRDQIQWLYGSGFPKSHNIGNGIGTALKPANEPIVLARKPLEKGLTVAQNVAKWGCGGLNIDASRVGNEPVPCQVSSTGSGFNKYDSSDYPGRRIYQSQGRWPANLLLDETAAEMLDEQSGISNARGGKPKTRSTKAGNVTIAPGGGPQVVRNDSGGASRFFYCAKASKSERNAGLEGMPEKMSEVEGAILCDDDSGNPNTKGRKANPIDCITQNKSRIRNGNFHPTVKPIKLMEYLIRLITQPGGTVLDPFMGSGSTGVAAKRLGFNFIGIEMNEEYVEIAKKRIESASA